MDYSIILGMIKDQPDEEDYANLLTEMCEDIHACCSDGCLMILEGHVKKGRVASVWVATHKDDWIDPRQRNYPGCPFFKNGTKMLKAIRRVNY